MDKGDGSAEAWIATFTTQLRSLLPKGQFILSHAREYPHRPASFSSELPD